MAYKQKQVRPQVDSHWATCPICKKRFWHTRGRKKVTCSLKCAKQLRVESCTKVAKADREIEPLEMARIMFVVKHNSLVDAGMIKEQRLPMDW